MVNLNTGKVGEVGFPKHILKSKIVFNGFELGTTKWCMIQKMRCGRFGVMASDYKDMFYKVFTEVELHESFDEQETMLGNG